MTVNNERVSWAARRDRRQQMAGEVTDSRSIGRVAAKHGVTLETVRAACRVYAPEKLSTYTGPQPRRRPQKV